MRPLVSGNLKSATCPASISTSSVVNEGGTLTAPGDAQDVHTDEEEGSLWAEIPFNGRKHARNEDVVDDTDDVVGVSSEDDGLGTETSGGDLSDEAVADGSYGELVEEGEDDEERSRSP